MSVVHEALKRARGEEAPVRPSLALKSPDKQPAVLFWAMLFIVIAEAIFCVREHQLRLHAEEKMRSAYLELNDVRRTASDLRELRMKVIDVEKDNLQKEKKISGLTKRLHDSEMEKIRLSEVLSK